VPGLLRLIQSIPSPKAEPFKRWLAQVGYERLQEIGNPELAARRVKEIYRQKGFPENKQAARDGGQVAGNARKELEEKSGRKVSTRENFKELPENLRRLDDVQGGNLL